MENKQLFCQFITENLDAVYRFAYTYMKNREDAEDIVSESVQKALKHIDTLQNPSFLKTWFYRIVINTAITELRKRSKIVYMSGEDLESIAGKKIDDYSDLDFDDLLRLLSTTERSIIVLRFLEDRKLSEIAELLNMNENTVKTRLYAALRKLHVEMEGVSNE